LESPPPKSAFICPKRRGGSFKNSRANEYKKCPQKGPFQPLGGSYRKEGEKVKGKMKKKFGPSGNFPCPGHIFKTGNKKNRNIETFRRRAVDSG